MKSTILIGILSYVLFISIGAAQAKEVARDQYLKQVPLSAPRLVQQTAASDALHLYGDRDDPAYRDVDPVDGIDDDRYRILMALAVRFAPYLVQNTTNLPTNFNIYIRNRDRFPLYVDTWDITGAEPRLLESKEINVSVLGEADCSSSTRRRALDEHPVATMDGMIEDCKLLELLGEYSPWETPMKDLNDKIVRERPELFSVLFFNWPGEGPENWEIGYETEYENTPAEKRTYYPHAYVHPFLIEVTGETGGFAGYELVLQYWFFYPSNDSGMNHEGDWEHMNVLIAPRSTVGSALSADTVNRILTGALPAGDDTLDPLVIRRVDYYFHHLVMTLDFSSPNVYQPRNVWQEDVKARPKLRFQESEIWKAVRRMAYVDDDETVVNTHPFGYIGADNKGLDQALAAPGGKNRNPHGTYPFPGRYQSVGPGGTNDQIAVFVDPRKYWKQLKEGKTTEGPEFKRGRVIGLADSSRLCIVPDWERIADLTRSDARVRREWSWWVLPIRWGYPATQSPFSGVLEHFDTGNVSPVGPSFNPGWNASGPAPGYFAYEPHALPSIFPLGFQDSFRNDLGFLNLTLPVLVNLPPLDFLSRIAAYPVKRAFGRRDPVYYPKEGLPFRFVGISSGVSTQILGKDFNALAFNQQQLDEFLFQLAWHLVVNGADSTTSVIGGGDFKTNSVQPFIQIAFYFGGRFTTENTVRNVRSTFGTNVEFNNIPPYRYSADLNLWEYVGSFRYSLSASRFQPFLKAGYGWSWYRLENVQANGELFEQPSSDWIKPKNIWPNVWHFGLGIEFIPWKRTGKLPGGADIAFRFEYARYLQSLGLDLSEIPLNKLEIFFPTLGDVPVGTRVSRDDFVFGVTVSF